MNQPLAQFGGRVISPHVQITTGPGPAGTNVPATHYYFPPQAINNVGAFAPIAGNFALNGYGGGLGGVNYPLPGYNFPTTPGNGFYPSYGYPIGGYGYTNTPGNGFYPSSGGYGLAGYTGFVGGPGYYGFAGNTYTGPVGNYGGRFPMAPAGTVNTLAGMPSVSFPIRRKRPSYEAPPYVPPSEVTSASAKPAAAAVSTVTEDAADVQKYMDRALSVPSSEAAKSTGLDNNSLTSSQKEEIKRTVVASQSESQGFLQSIADNVMAFISAVLDMGKGKPFWQNVKQHYAERVSLRNATKTFEALNAPDATGVNRPYAAFASSVSGVQPDGKGGYQPVMDASGQPMGLYSRGVGRLSNPDGTKLQDEQDRGTAPTQAQLERSVAIVDQELNAIYSDPANRAIIEAYRERQRISPGKNEEPKAFASDPKIRRQILAIADKLEADEAITTGVKYSYKKHRADILKQIDDLLKQKHYELFDRNAGSSGPAPDVSMLAAQIKAKGAATGGLGYDAIGAAWKEEAKSKGISDANAEKLATLINSASAYGDAGFRELSTDQQKAKLSSNPQMVQLLNSPQGELVRSVIDSMVPKTKQAIIQAQSPAADKEAEAGAGFSGAAPLLASPLPSPVKAKHGAPTLARP